MKYILIILFISLSNYFGYSQSVNNYDHHLALAKDFFAKKQYSEAGYHLNLAFQSNNDKGRLDHRYLAAQSWILAGKADSALYELRRISKSGLYTNAEFLMEDSLFFTLHNSEEWKIITSEIKEAQKKLPNKTKQIIPQQGSNKRLTSILDTVYVNDQRFRKNLNVDSIQKYDVINKEIVTKILDEFGWLGVEEVGRQGNSALFLVIQHADQETQEKYLPMLKKAVQQRKAHASNLAMLEDRIAIRRGEKQIYGSQISIDINTNQAYVAEIEDPGNVDMRRAKLGLPPMKEYVKHWNINWSLEQYYSDLDKYEKTK